MNPDTIYLLRIVNMGLFTSHYVYIEDHTFTIVEVDGVVVEPYETDSLYVAVAQRYVVLMKTKKVLIKFPICQCIRSRYVRFLATGFTNCFDQLDSL